MPSHHISSHNLPYEKVGKNEPVCIADEVPFEIPDSWVWVRLGTLMKVISDGTHKTPNYVEQGVPFLSVQNISKGVFDLSRIKYITQEEHEKLIQRVKPEKNDILICRIGTLGKAIKSTVDFEFSIFVSLGLLRPVDYDLSDYIVFAINSPLGDKWIQDNKVGGGTHTYKINLVDLPNMLIPLPPLKEQQRIFNKLEEFQQSLDEYDNKERLLISLNDSFPDALKKSILQQAVMGKLVPQDPNDEPASVLLERIRTGKASLVKAGKLKKDKHESIIYRRDNSHYEKRNGQEVCIDDELPFDIPDSWAWMRLSSFGIFNSGKTPSMSEPKNWGGNVPWISSKDMKRQIILDSEMHITELASNTMQIYPKGTLLLVARSGILRRLLPLCILGVESTINQDIKAFSLYDNSQSEWIFYSLKAFEPIILKDYVKSVTTVESLKFDEFSNLLIPVPPYQEQRRIIQAIKEFVKLISPIYIDPLFSL